MKMCKSFIGALAVLFSIQSIAAWAYESSEKSGPKQITKIELARSEKGAKEGGPSCHGG